MVVGEMLVTKKNRPAPECWAVFGLNRLQDLAGLTFLTYGQEQGAGS
jgi:hypothetical protein